MALERVGVCILVVAALGVMACAGSGSEGEAGTGDSNPGGNFGAGGIDGRGGSGAEGPGPGGSTGGAGGGPGGAGGTASRHVSLPFANCEPVDDVVAIHPDLMPDRDPYCDDWVDMPPLEIDQFGEVQIGDVNAQRGFAVSGCMVAFGSNVNEVYFYDLEKNRRRRTAGLLGAPGSIAFQGNALVFDSIECREEGGCESALQITDVDTCKTGRHGIRNRDERSTEYRLVSISEGRVVWYEYPGQGCAIGFLDLSTNQSSLLTEVGLGICNSHPHLSGDWLTWTRNEPDGSVVMLRNLQTGEERQITPSGQASFNPSTDGRYVMWSDNFGATEDIYAYDIETDMTFPVVTAPGSQGGGEVRDGVASWSDQRDSVSDTYGFTSAYYEKVLPDGEERLIRQAHTPLIYAIPIGEGLIWLDARTNRDSLWALPKR